MNILNTMDINEILKCLPHRYPFLLVDRVVDFEPGKFIHAYKNISINEPFFVGHFPHYPVLPGVLIMEALAQVAGILSFKTLGIQSDSNSLFFFVGIDNARFKKPVLPGDQPPARRTLASCAQYRKIQSRGARRWRGGRRGRVDERQARCGINGII